MNAQEQFRGFIAGIAGGDPGPIVADGKWHRFNPGDTKHRSSRPARYMMHGDGKPNGIYMDWRDGKKHPWKGDGGNAPDPSAMQQQRADRDRERLAAYQRAADKAVAYWRECKTVEEHPYLTAKLVGPHGVRLGSGRPFGLTGDCVIIPVLSSEGDPLSLQAIAVDGERRFWPGSTHEAGYMAIGTDDGTSPVVLVEGYATGATIHEATGWLVLNCLNSSGLVDVARWATHRYAGREFIVAGDDDWHLPLKPVPQPNAGKDHATAAARILGGRAIFPQMLGLDTDGGDDFNDVAREYGRDEVLQQLTEARDEPLPPPEPPLPLLWFDEIEPLLNNNWVVKNVIPAEALVTIIGHPGCGKSFLALDMSLHVASGREWQGNRVTQGLVVYLAAEGQRGQQNRVTAWRMTHGGDALPFAMLPVAVNLRDPEADIPQVVETIRAAVARAGMDLAILVVDTLNRTFGGGDENGEDMTQYVANVGRIKAEFGCTTIVVHHLPKNSDNPTERGHGSLRGAVETSLLVTKDPENTIRTLKCTKQKDAEDGWTTRFDLRSIQLGHDEDGDPVTSCVIEAVAEDHSRHETTRGPSLSPTQRAVYNELMAALEAAPIGIPRDVPDGMVPSNVGKVVSRATWRERYVAVAGGGDTARRGFDRSVTELQNKKLVGGWNDVIWPVYA